MDELREERGGRLRPPWFVAFLGRRLIWALVTLLIFLTAVFFFVQVWVPYTWATQFLIGGLARHNDRGEADRHHDRRGERNRQHRDRSEPIAHGRGLYG